MLKRRLVPFQCFAQLVNCCWHFISLFPRFHSPPSNLSSIHHTCIFQRRVRYPRVCCRKDYWPTVWDCCRRKYLEAPGYGPYQRHKAFARFPGPYTQRWQLRMGTWLWRQRPVSILSLQCQYGGANVGVTELVDFTRAQMTSLNSLERFSRALCCSQSKQDVGLSLAPTQRPSCPLWVLRGKLRALRETPQIKKSLISIPNPVAPGYIIPS